MDLLNTLQALGNRPTFLSMLSVTEPKLAKGCPYRNVRKISKVFGIANFRYQNSVNAQREREGLLADLEAKPRQWGFHVPGSPLIVHKGKYYLEIKVEKILKHARYLSEGKFISPEAIKPYLPSKRDSGRQEVDKAIILRDYSLESIRNLRIGGKEIKA